MKKKKMLLILIIVIVIISLPILYFFKPMTMNDIYDKPNFTGVVEEVHDKAILVSVNEYEDEIKSSDKMVVSLEVKLKDSITRFKVGDKVKIFYDGTILESYPAQINFVYAILLINEE